MTKNTFIKKFNPGLPSDENIAFDEIIEYFNGITRLMERKIAAYEKTEEKPEDQHQVPKFLLRHFAQESPPYIPKAKDLMLSEYLITVDTMQDKILPIQRLPDISPTRFSVRKNVYFTNALPTGYEVEMLFSIIEGDAAKILRSRLNQNYTDIQNPYYFPSINDLRLQKKTQQRAALAVFLSAQSLRSPSRHEGVLELVNRLEPTAIDYADAVRNMIFPNAIDFFNRPWAWMRFPNQDLILSEEGVVSSSKCFANKGNKNKTLSLTLTRNDAIVLLDKTNGFYSQDDAIIIAEQETIKYWLDYYYIQNIESYEIEGTIHRYKFLLNKHAKKIPVSFSAPEGCCFNHYVLNIIPENYTIPLIVGKDLTPTKTKS